MLSPWFGEFMGTLVLILMGDGVVAGVLLNKSKAENSGWIVITTGWAMAVIAGVFTAIACGSPGAHLESRGDTRPGDSQRRLFEFAFFFHGADAGWNSGSDTGLASFFAALEGDSRPGCETGGVLQFSGNP